MATHRTKGKVAEREVAKLIKQWWNAVEPDAKFVRTPLSGGWSDDDTRSEFKATGDLMTTSPSFPFDVEVKRRENWDEGTFFAGLASPVWGWWRQTQRSAMLSHGRERRHPMLWFRHNRKPWLVMLSQTYLSNLFRGRPADSLPSSLCSQCIKPVDVCACRVPRFGSGTLGSPHHVWGDEMHAVHYGVSWPVLFQATDLLAVHPLRLVLGSHQAPVACPGSCPVCGKTPLRAIRGAPKWRRCSECGWQWTEENVVRCW